MSFASRLIPFNEKCNKLQILSTWDHFALVAEAYASHMWTIANLAVVTLESEYLPHCVRSKCIDYGGLKWFINCVQVSPMWVCFDCIQTHPCHGNHFFSSSSLQITWTTFVKYIYMQTNQLYVRLKCIAYANTPYPFKSTHKIVLLVIWGQRGKIMLHDFGAQFYWLLNVLLYAIDMTNSWSLFSHKYLITSVKI